MDIFVFSYNRGAFLQNCIDSLLRHARGSRICIVDDHSDCPDTRAYLASLPAGVELIYGQVKDGARHGGLYNNMQRALDNCQDELIFFIQDDMQVVRDIDDEDLRYINDFFTHYPDAAFLHPMFLRGRRNRRDKRITRLESGFPVYFREQPEKKNHRDLTYVDGVIAHANRLKAANWQFVEGEAANANQAAPLFGKMGIWPFPVAMFLPEVPVYRGKHKTWAVSKAEQLAGTTPKAFIPMSQEDTSRLRARDLRELPVAEDFLQCSVPVKRPFHYSVVNVYPALRALHKLQQLISRR
ncbi:glycosyltransferase family A protein [Pseudohongiella spirulinae]|nr:glycosyltransferase family A protein [Pseudohongiella spirulinae]